MGFFYIFREWIKIKKSGIVSITIRCMKSAMDFQIERIFKGPGFAETLYLGFKNRKRVIRKASNPDAYSFSKTALIREIRLIKSLPDELKQFFPTLLDTNLGDEPENSSGIPDVIYYDMPYYSPEEGWVTLSQSLLDGRIVKRDARKVLGEVMEVAFRYFQIDERIPSPDYPEKTMFTAIRESIKWAGSDEDFTSLFTVKKWLINGKEIYNVPSLNQYFHETSPLIDILTPYRDRFLHGDFFPENIMFNTNNYEWLLLDPVSVRGVHRGDFVLDLNKMDDWLSGELPALRIGQFEVTISGSQVDLTVHKHTGRLEKLHGLGLEEWYAEQLKNHKHSELFLQEKNWKIRYLFAKAFYCFCMLPLADKRQAIARDFLALKTMGEFNELYGEISGR